MYPLLQAQLYEGEFPVMKGPSVKGEKLHQVWLDSISWGKLSRAL